MNRKQKGFTLIELLIVVAIIGILAAIAIPNLLTAMQRSKQKRTMADMRTIASAWEARATDVNGYDISGAQMTWPEPTSDIATLDGPLTPTYVKRLPVNDGWGSRFLAGVTADGNNYSVKSLGADALSSSSVTSATIPLTTANFDCDIIFSDGNFVMYPEGVQGQ